MLLGVLLQVGILVLCGLWGVRANQTPAGVHGDLYAGVAHAHELFLHAGHALFWPTLFAEREDEILPSFWGSNAIMLVAGTVLYGVFLLFSAPRCCRGCCACGCSTL